LAKLTKKERTERLRDRIEKIRKERNDAWAEAETLDETLEKLQGELNELFIEKR